MRKIKKMMVTVVTMMAIAMSLTGCGNPFRKDDKHATVSVTTSDGQAYVFQSVNGSNCTVSGKENALQHHKFNLNLKTGETASYRVSDNAANMIESIPTGAQVSFRYFAPQLEDELASLVSICTDDN